MEKQSKRSLVKTKMPDPAKDLTGKRFGKWLVLEYAGRKVYQSRKTKTSMQLWLCRCECGVQKNIPRFSLIQRRTTQCQNCALVNSRVPFDPGLDLTGKRFGKWLVLGYMEKKHCHRMWRCRCECGAEKDVSRSNLLRKFTTQCQRCAWSSRRKPHKILFQIWKARIQSGQFPPEWQDFDTFRQAVGDPPSDFTRLAKYDLTKPHGPGNTFWMTKKAASQIRQIRQKLFKESVVQNKVLQKISTAKTKDEKKRYLIAARKAGYTYELIGIAAGLTHQRVQQIVTKSME